MPRAKRSRGTRFPHPGAEYEEFADRFEFQETDDQLAAIDQVLLRHVAARVRWTA